MGKYIEDISLPYGPEEAAQRVGQWLRGSGSKYKVKKKAQDFVKVQGHWGNIIIGKTNIIFELWFRPEGIHAECWTGGGLIKSSIKPSAVWGRLPKGKAWEDYSSLKSLLLQ